MFTNKKILVTGATGNLGRALLQELKLTTSSVRIMSRRSLSHLTSENEWVGADLQSGEGIEDAVEGVDVIFHLASDPRNAATTDVEGTKHLLRAAKQNKVTHLIYISIVGVDEIPHNYYRYKQDVECVIENAGLPYSILRATQFHSLVEIMISSAAKVPLVMPLPLDFQFQSVAELDVARRLIRCLSEGPGGRITDFGGPEILTIRTMAQTWMEVRQMRKKLLHLPLPGKVAAAFRTGANTNIKGDQGLTNWQDWLLERASNAPMTFPEKAISSVI